MSNFFENKRVVVTGGNGFLGGYVIKGMQKRNCKHILVPTIESYDLVYMDDIIRMYKDMEPDIVIHLAAVVGGIGANREHPGEFFYKNLMMGVQLIEQGRLHEIEKFVAIGTAYILSGHVARPGIWILSDDLHRFFIRNVNVLHQDIAIRYFQFLDLFCYWFWIIAGKDAIRQVNHQRWGNIRQLV